MKAILPLLLPLLTMTAAPAFSAPASCPQASEQLSDYLAPAKRRIGADGEVRVEFRVDADGQAQVLSMDGTRIYRTPVRTAVDVLECQAGTPQHYVLNIRFADPRPVAVATAASATVAEAGQSRTTTSR